VVFKLGGAQRWLFALGLAQAGEFGFVLLSFTVANSVLPVAVADQLLLVVALSMLLTPALFIFYDRVVTPRYDKSFEREADAFDQANSVIIAGSGRVGALVDRMLAGAGIETTMVEYSSQQIESLRAFGRRTYFGDATRPDLLHAAGIAEAKVLIVAIDGKDQITELVRYALANYPDLHVVARAVDRNHVYDLYAAGCRDIVRETYDSTLRMGRSTFEALGVSRDKAERMVEAFNQMDRRAMVAVADAYDVNIPVMENKVFIERVRESMGSWREELNETMTKIMKEP